MSKRPWLSLRKNLLTKAKRKHGDREMEWVGGVLFFTDTNPPTRVPKVQHVPKPERETIGLRAHETTAMTAARN